MNSGTFDRVVDDILLTFKSKWRVFLAGLLAQFIMTVFLYLGIQLPKVLDFLSLPRTKLSSTVLLSPLPLRINILENLRPKLEQKENNFDLQKPRSFIPSAYAYGHYENANSYIAIDYENGQVLAGNLESKRVPIASITKIMTAVVALDLASKDELFEVSYRASRIPPTKIGVVPGQKLSLDELLHALLLTSANDSAEVIKEGINKKYGGEVFIEAMNAKAKFIGLKNTSFDNPQGFDGKENFSCAEDVAILAKYAIDNYPLFSEIVKKDYQLLEANQDHKKFDLYNWNGLLGVYPGVFGVKIGNTDDAGTTTVVASEREGKKVLAVVLGAPGVLERDMWAAELLDLGFEKLGLLPVNITEGLLREKYSTWKFWG